MGMLRRLAFAGAFLATPCWPRQWAGGRLCFFLRQSLSTIWSKVDSGVAGVGAGRMPTERVPALCGHRSEEHTSELQSLMRISYAVFCLKKKKKNIQSTSQTI